MQSQRFFSRFLRIAPALRSYPAISTTRTTKKSWQACAGAFLIGGVGLVTVAAAEGDTKKEKKLKAVTVYCGSSTGNSPEYMKAAVGLGKALAKESIMLVYGGGSIGLMGGVANAVNDNGGEVMGIIPKVLSSKEVSNEGVGTVIVVDSMHTRKKLMESEADAFIALPGGLGTWEELTEILTWGQLGIHNKPVGVLNINGYYDPLLAMIEKGIAQGFIAEKWSELLVVDDDPERLLKRLSEHKPPKGYFTWKSSDL